MCAQLSTNQADPLQLQGWKSPISPICPIAAGKGSWKMCVEPNQPTSSRWQGWKSPTRAALRSGSALFSSWVHYREFDFLKVELFFFNLYKV